MNENEIKKEIELEIKSKEFICPNCRKKCKWINNPYDGYDSFCIYCKQRWQGYKY